MALTLITGPANAGKAQLVLDAVRRELALQTQPLLVVPTRADAEHYRRELAGEGALMGARVERFAGFIREAVQRAGVATPAIGAQARLRVLSAIVAREAAATPGFVRALAAFVAELRVRRVTAARLDQALGQWAAADGPQASGGRIGALLAGYECALEEMGRVDGEQLAVRALDALRRRPALWGRTPVFFYGFDDFDRLQLDAIETLATVVDAPVTVSLTYERGRIAFAGRAGTFQALAPLAAAHTELGARADYYAPAARAALSHLERSLFEEEATRADPGGSLALLEGGGERDELELVAREIGGLLERGMAAGEIAVVVRAPGAAGDLLDEVFAAAGFPYAQERRRPFADTALGSALIGLLRCGTADGGLSDLLAWLRAPGLLERPELADSLEAGARRTGALSAAAARDLWERRHWSLDTIDHLREAADRGAGALIERTERELGWLFCAPRRRAGAVLGDDELDEARALTAARRALGELRELARVSPGLAPADAGELAHALEGVDFLSGEQPTAEAVAVLDPLDLRARRVRALFVCRLQEGVFPAPARSQPLLGEEERRRLAQASGLRLAGQEDALAAERYLFYAALSRPQEMLVLSWHTADEDGAPRARSLFVDDVCDLFDEALSARRSQRALGALGATGADRPAGVNGAPVPAAAAQAGPQLRDEQLLSELSRRVWSASALEQWIRCPVRWFVERVLRARDIEADPEPLARGGLAHAALRDTFEGLRRERGSARLDPHGLGLARELLRQALERNEPDFRLSLAPEREPGVRRRLRADLERYLEYAAEAGAACDGGLEPRYLELAFGFGAEQGRDHAGDQSEGGLEGDPLPALDLGGGLILRGRIDRVDVGEDGEAIVYDYKGPSAPAGAKWLGEGSLQVALYMRAVEDLLGLRVVGGFYQPLRGARLRARGVLDADGGVELDCVRTDRLDHLEFERLLEDAAQAAREVAEAAARGRLGARPRTCAFGGGCMYPAICRCER